jgi:hypothetical protein
MYFAATLLIFGVHGLNIVHDNPHHCLVAHRSGKFPIAHSSDVKMRALTRDPGIGRWGVVTKSLGEPA